MTKLRNLISGGLLLSTAATAHEAPAGWAYDTNCCGNQDCYQLTDDTVRITAQGYLIPDGRVIPYHDGRIHPSKDGHYHLCTATWPDADTQLPHIFCLYTPPESY